MGFKATTNRAPARYAPEVETWFAHRAHPQEQTMRRVRDVILGADPRVAECIKWKSPTFTFNGNLASINPQAKKHVSLMFHRGAEIPGDHPALAGGGDTARYMTFADPAEVEALRPALEAVVRAWCAWKDG